MYRYLLFIALLLSSCTNNRLATARRLKNKQKFAGAIEFYDNFLKYEIESANKTKAVVERSGCYYQLGKIAVEKKNWELGKRFFYLANSKKADSELDNCYFQLGNIAKNNHQFDLKKEYDQIIIDNFHDSEFVPSIYSQRLNLAITNQEYQTAWNLYKKFYNSFPEDIKFADAEKKINSIIQTFIKAKTDEMNSEDKITFLTELTQYPNNLHDEIFHQIATIHIKLAEDKIAEQQYIEADTNFKLAIKIDPSKQNYVKQRLNEICSLFIIKGESLLAERKIDLAIQNFRITYEIIPNYDVANRLIAKAELKKKNIEIAKKHYNNAKTNEMRGDYQKALENYQLSFDHDNLPKTNKKLSLMKNLIEIKKSPKKFAKQIFYAHQKGNLIKKVSDFEKQVLDKKETNSNEDGWKFILSFGEFNFEARYDLITSDKSYYFAWLINLKTKTISAMNKVTKDLESGKLE